jgi:hypothetical protein
MLDSDVKITFCSFRASMNAATRCDQLLDMYRQNCMSLADFMRVLANGFMYNFQDASVRREMTAEFWRRALAQLEPLGFRYFHKKSFFPASLPPKHAVAHEHAPEPAEK